MANPARLGFGKKKTLTIEQVADRLAFALRSLVELIPEPAGCRNCVNGPCAQHRRRETGYAALKDYEANK